MLLMNEDHSNARARRIAEAIENGPLSMSEIADKLDVARTSVLNWKRRGSINLDQLERAGSTNWLPLLVARLRRRPQERQRRRRQRAGAIPHRADRQGVPRACAPAGVHRPLDRSPGADASSCERNNTQPNRGCRPKKVRMSSNYV